MAKESYPIEEVTTMEQAVDMADAEFPEEILEEEGEGSAIYGKGGKRRHNGRAGRRIQTAGYKSRLKERADSAMKNSAKRAEEDEKTKGFKVDKDTGEKKQIKSATSRHENLSKMAGKYKTKKEKLLEQKKELQRVADGWKAKADEALQELEVFKASHNRFDETKQMELESKANDFVAKAKKAQEAADYVIIPE